MPAAGRYLLGNDAPEAMDRFTAFATLFDPSTFRHLDALGLAAGWRCWEVGAGGTTRGRASGGAGRAAGPRRGHRHQPGLGRQRGGAPTSRSSSTTWRATRRPAAPSTSCTPGSSWSTCPSATAPWPNMVAALRPGGVLLVEDADPALQPRSCLEETGPEEVLANRLRRGFRHLLSERGVDLAYGRTLPHRLRDAGLEDVAADAAFPIRHPACIPLEVATINLVRDQLVDREIRHRRGDRAAPGQRRGRPPRPDPAAHDLVLGVAPGRPGSRRRRRGAKVTASWWNRIDARRRPSPESLFHPAVARWFARRFPAGPDAAPDRRPGPTSPRAATSWSPRPPARARP